LTALVSREQLTRCGTQSGFEISGRNPGIPAMSAPDAEHIRQLLAEIYRSDSRRGRAPSAGWSGRKMGLSPSSADVLSLAL
jgi:hypothetical protein